MEEELLRILERDARVSTDKIAEILGANEKEIKKKIAEFEEKGVIRKYKTVINWEKFGKEKVYALIDIKVTPQRDRGYDSVAEKIMRFPEVKNLFLVSGLYDLSVLVQGDSMKEVANFVAEKLAPLEQVQSTVTHFLLKIYKEDGDILVEKEKNKRLAITP